ncbi:MAG: zf-HC2 domain-containing protein [Thermodesulfobacteriota bacterium]
MSNEHSDNHMDDLRLPYLEGLLSPEERSRFEAHVAECPACTSNLEDMGRWLSVLKAHGRDLCPEPWELFDYIRSGKDVLGTVASHLKECPSCRADAESLQVSTSRQRVPADLWAEISSRSEKPAADRLPGGLYQSLTDIFERVLDLFRPVVLAPVAVAAVVLIVVLLYPTGPAPRVVALSSVSWTPDAAELGLMGKDRAPRLPHEAKKDRLGVVILFKDFKRLPDQERIDSLYRALEPSKEVRDEYDVLAPAEFSRLAGQEVLKAPDDKALVTEMRSKLQISKAFVVEIVPQGDRFEVLTRLIDTATGEIIRKRDFRDLTEAELNSALDDAIHSTLHPTPNKEG